MTPPPEYFQIVYDIVRRHGGLCIADEVQTGFGRTGTAFWGFENWGVTPDLVTMAKGIGNGAPLGACVTRPEIARTMTNRIHFNTFGGNPISMTQGLATLEVIDSENIQENALQRRAAISRTGCCELQERQPLIGEVRGMGLMLGVELVRDRQTKEPATAETADVLELCKERGLLHRQGRPVRQLAADQAADVPDEGRRRFPGRLPGRSTQPDTEWGLKTTEQHPPAHNSAKEELRWRPM